MCQEDAGLLHDYRIIKNDARGVIEKCVNLMCGDKQFFPPNVPDYVYLSYHLKSALQPSDALFKTNYPHYVGQR